MFPEPTSAPMGGGNSLIYNQLQPPANSIKKTAPAGQVFRNIFSPLLSVELLTIY